MAEVIAFGPFYTHVVRLRKGSPFIHRAPTQEINDPYRSGRSFIVRLWPLKFGLVLGRWTDQTEDEQAALLKALLGRPDPFDRERFAAWGSDDDDLTCDCGDGH